MKNEVFIASAKRTPVGGFMGSLSGYSAPQLGAAVIRHILQETNIPVGAISSVYMGNVLGAGVGQSPARQAAAYAGIPWEADATTINKVCSSGLKSVMLGAQQIMMGADELVLAGGMESMSNVPHYVYARRGNKLGHMALTDGLTKDGLWDVYHDYHMGNAAEVVIRKYGLTREMLDDYTVKSYQKAQQASNDGLFMREMVPVTTQVGDVIQRDEDIDKVIYEKIPRLKPVFEEGGTLTAANASNLNDGAGAVLLASADAIKKYHLQPVARIAGFADAAQAPELFTTSPVLAVQKALANAGVSLEQIDFFEFNEAYASVPLLSGELLSISPDKINAWGGAVAIGHPIGASGTRILATLCNILVTHSSGWGVAAICNGGGGASAMVIERY